MKLKLANPYFIKQLLKCKSNIENSTEAFRPPLDSRNAQPQHNCRDRGWYKNICHSGMLCRMVQTQTTKRRKQRTIQKPKGDTWKQVSKKQTLIKISWGASRSPNSFFSNFSYIQTTVKKKNKMKIQVAIIRKILVAI